MTDTTASHDRLALGDRVIIVTGAAGGIGAATAALLAARGARLMLADCDAGALERQAAALSCSTDVSTMRVDVADDGAVAAMVAATLDRFGRIDGACNFAGILPPFAGLDDLSASRWSRTLSINLHGAFSCLMHETAAMRAHGNGGSIVMMGSVAGRGPGQGLIDYCTSKETLTGLVRAAARDLAPNGIRVNLILPGTIYTPMTAPLIDHDETVKAMVLGSIPLGHFGQAVDIAEAAAWLLSDAAGFVTGAEFVVDGGQSLPGL